MLGEETTLDEIAILRIKEFEPKDEPYWLAFSGGKDSIVLKHLVDRAEVKYEAHYNVTTVDPPELTRYIKKHYPDVIRDIPEKSMFEWIVKKGFPLRQARWCCEKLKEKGGIGRRVLTGCRWAESPRRKKQRKLYEIWTGDRAKEMVNPIIDWSDADVWQYIRQKEIPYCELYDDGIERIGCIMCPMSSNMQREALRWPGIRKAYFKAFVRLYERRVKEGNESVKRWSSPEEMFEWWINGKGNSKAEGQQCLQFG